MKDKTENLVFDTYTLKTLYKLSNDGYFDTLWSTVSSGKEGLVISGRNKEWVAIKIYFMNTSEFNTMRKYIIGDRRFENIKQSKRDIILNWCKKEYRNLLEMYDLGMTPKPIAQRNNVLIMEFIGNNGVPAPSIKDKPPENPKEWYDAIINFIKDLYRKKGLVHGDLNEFNILNNGKPVVIDVSQAVPLDHPLARTMLERDITNINNYFKKLGVKVESDVKWSKQ
ncbi:serine protein kinase RIO [Nanoarchaeota archaeon]|nr:MAG: serine protein kinase RIO [Nanoarchaeota archaeon]